jgi:hypothetical protein
MDITVYLPDEIGRWAKNNELNLSRMLRDAVEAEQDHRENLKAWRGEAAVHKLVMDGGYLVRLHATVLARSDHEMLFATEDGRVYVYNDDAQALYGFDPSDKSPAVVNNSADPELWKFSDPRFYLELMKALGKEATIDIGAESVTAPGADD